MIKFPRQISSEAFEYTSTDSLTEFSDKLEYIASKSRSFNASPNLFVRLLPGNEFTATVKVGMGPLNNSIFGFGTSAVLKGQYFKNNFNATQVSIIAAPHYLFAVFFLILPILFMVMLLINIESGQKFPEIYPLTFIMMIAAPASLLFISALSKERLLKRFASYMQLTKIASH
jgi:hypothetical protein